jgi:hypothetical protein
MLHAESASTLPTNRKGQSGKALLCAQQDNLTTSVAHFCTAVFIQNRVAKMVETTCMNDVEGFMESGFETPRME